MSLAELHRQVLFGKSNGKIIWQPRIGCWYDDKIFNQEELPHPFTGLDLPGIYKKLGCSARIYDYNNCFKIVEDPSVQITERPLNDKEILKVIKTPVGEQTSIVRRSDNNPGLINVKWEITTEEDFKIATWRAQRATWVYDSEMFEQVKVIWGDIGAPTIYLPRVSIQHLFLDTMGVENAIYALYDIPNVVEAYFEAINECHERLIEVVNDSPIEIVNFGDNLHQGTLPPNLFAKYVLPVYHSRCELLHKANKFIHAHWDGDIKNLLPFAQQTRLDGIEALTPQPQGDVTLEEIKEALGDKLFLLDGIPAIYFDTYFPVEVLEECTHKIIEMFAPKLVLGISDEVSSTGDLERFYVVSKIVDEYNAQFD